MDRRTFLDLAMASGVAAALPWSAAAKPDDRFKMNAIPSSGEAVPAVGLGSWITFNVGDDPVLLDSCAAVMEAFFRAGGNMIDSSPMYGSSQTTIGYGLEKLNRVGSVFCAEKVWTSDAREGRDQIDRSKTNWGASRLDLVQVHNLVAWRDHLPILQAMKESGEIRYIGITTSHGRRHDELEKVMKNYPVDFVQLTYNPVDREAENRLLPMARERGIAVIVNRPFRRGILPDRLANIPVPSWADAIGAKTWAQVILKFIISHPFVTCAIPATTRVDHVLENVGAASEPFPDEDLRARIVEAVMNS